MRAILLMALLAGCGFEGEEVFRGRRFPGVAPWTDIGPITVCDGQRRLGPVRAGALGLCEKGGGEARTCTADSGCGNRELCVCGRCVVAACDSTDECADGQVCDFGDQRCDRACESDSECQAGERCQPGRNRCRGVCEADTDCQAGETCQRGSGLCVVTSCTSDNDCSGGRLCRLQRQPAALAEPSPLVDGTRVTLFLERADPMPGTKPPVLAPPDIYRAISDDGRHFTLEPRLPVLKGLAPSVARDRRGGLLMVYVLQTTPVLIRATSQDGITWQSSPIGIIADSPSLAQRRDGSFVLYYAVPDGATGGRGISRALSSDGVRFDAGDTVLEPASVSDPVLWRAIDRLASPYVQIVDDPTGRPFDRLWFAAHGQESAASVQFGKVIPTAANFSIGEAAAYPGSRLVPYPFNPVFDRVLEFLTHPSELDPAVITYGNGWLLYYRRAAADGTKSDNLALAKSP